MKQTNCILPVQCKRCETIFDLWYDLNEETSINEALEDRDLIRNFRESLCWRCRHQVLRKLYENLKTEQQKDEQDLMLVLDE